MASEIWTQVRQKRRLFVPTFRLTSPVLHDSDTHHQDVVSGLGEDEMLP